jgi:hypothetical protein
MVVKTQASFLLRRSCALTSDCIKFNIRDLPHIFAIYIAEMHVMMRNLKMICYFLNPAVQLLLDKKMVLGPTSLFIFVSPLG